MPAPTTKSIEYNKICFVIMPFNKKTVDNKEIDFDQIYLQVFKPAIEAVDLPEGGKLIPKRTDQDYFSGNIDVEMFQYLEYSRFAFVDITGLNANVFYELGVRHHANQSGTAIFRQPDKPIPFDISRIKAFPYEYEPMEKVEESKKLIRDVLTESLQYNRLDSPVQIALAAQILQAPKINPVLMDATNAMRNGDTATAIAKYEQAIQFDKKNPLLHQEKGLLLKKQGKWKEAAAEFEEAVRLANDYSEALRELGIAQNKIYYSTKDTSLPTGEEALKRSIDLNNGDFDALASLGGIYKRLERYDDSAEKYNQSLEVSRGHSYPLVNAIVLQVKQKGVASITAKQKMYMRRAEVQLKKQVTDTPPYNAPWSFFDLSTIHLFLGNAAEALQVLNDGLAHSAHDWEPKTHLATLALIKDRANEVPGLQDILNTLTELVA